VAGAVRATVRHFGRLDLLWANAGTGVAKTVPETTLEEWDRVLAVNLTGAFLLAKYGIPELAAAGGGTMVITGSANSFTADRSWAAYCASKGGLLMLCRALALDHAADGIRVNIVCPGSVTTPLHEEWLAGRPGGQTLAQTRDADRAAHPLGRFADPAEVARAALFLSCAESSFTTGAPLLVDGGVTA
jgi:NAD(P)-dependent dehydrogenase (short-subunit alcohol dehydrogenase family)